MPVSIHTRSKSQESAQFEMSDVFNTPNSMLQQQPRGPISEPGPMPNPRPQGQNGTHVNGQSKPRPPGSAIHDFAYPSGHPAIQQDPSNNARSATQSPGLWKPEETRDMLELQRDPVHSENTQQAIQAQQTLQAHTYLQDQGDAFDESMAGETLLPRTFGDDKKEEGDDGAARDQL
ncbi:hypothetical protein AUEXF2481DRAFT_27337 [Aureobasidium subglaciale EXF-2481]|uniref:Uncharacterized protein n=1 Tax=Aureobasidium subglaciale (strain EXF-2481) TaxID=1043005 RepID=A0A074YJX3_AURSE|nr:uncharacterized protein AUEXF2481DRAFT_27337 [Aureobasidium subglaciale EXF-2481]KEQ98000.1 hypothetical protein AUEXF2481DRAFT_27337 [Aureobasidium subglaciale EXF-2481]